jgi:hypothetical protein
MAAARRLGQYRVSPESDDKLARAMAKAHNAIPPMPAMQGAAHQAHPVRTIKIMIYLTLDSHYVWNPTMTYTNFLCLSLFLCERKSCIFVAEKLSVVLTVVIHSTHRVAVLGISTGAPVTTFSITPGWNNDGSREGSRQAS